MAEEEPLFHGRCFCNALSLTIYSPPTKVYLCHCTDCQRLTGSVFAHNASFPTSAIHVEVHGQALRGWKPPANDKGHGMVDTRELLKLTNSTGAGTSNDDDDTQPAPTSRGAAASLEVADVLRTFGTTSTGTQEFCGACGTRMFVRCRKGIKNMRGQTVVPVGVIDGSGEDERLRPRGENRGESRVDWLSEDIMLDGKGSGMRRGKRRREETAG